MERSNESRPEPGSTGEAGASGQSMAAAGARAGAGDDGGREMTESIVIHRSRPELYAFCRDFTHMPRFMERVRSVTEVDALSSLWTLVDENGQAQEWEVIVTDEERDRLIAWATSGRTPAHYTGRVELEDVSPGATRIKIVIREASPEGLFDQLISRVTGGAPPLAMCPDLARLKALMEAGEPVQLPGTSARGAAASERGVGVIAPEHTDPEPVSVDLQ